jgi:RhoGAP domain
VCEREKVRECVVVRVNMQMYMYVRVLLYILFTIFSRSIPFTEPAHASSIAEAILSRSERAADTSGTLVCHRDLFFFSALLCFVIYLPPRHTPTHLHTCVNSLSPCGTRSSKALECETIAQMTKLLTEVSEVSRRVIEYLVAFVQLIGHPSYQPATRMTLENMAVVFAPSLIRSGTDDPLVAMQNSTKERKFVELLFSISVPPVAAFRCYDPDRDPEEVAQEVCRCELLECTCRCVDVSSVQGGKIVYVWRCVEV